MPTARSLLFLVSVGLVMTGAVGLAEESSETAAELRALRAEVAALRQSIAGLEQRLDAGKPADDHAWVTVRVQDTTGQPIAGADVRMRSADQGPAVQATGRARENGVALSRRLPHREYAVHVSVPGGWYARPINVVTEYGAPLDLVITCPAANEKATVHLTSELRREALDGLRFGVKLTDRGNNAGWSFAAEPGAESDPMETFPTIDDGIARVAARVSFRIKQQLKTSTGRPVRWQWNGGPHGVVSNRLATSTGDIRAIDEATRHRAPWPGPKPGYFNWAAQGTRYHHLTLAEADGATVEVPAGRVSVVLDRFLGEATPAVAKALRVEEDEPVWLRAALRPESRWLDRLVGREWKSIGGYHGELEVAQERELAAGETWDLVIASP